jgi:predicted O-methyltransferase YrrM
VRTSSGQSNFNVRKIEIRFVDVPAGEARSQGWMSRAVRHPFFAWAGLRPLIAQHTAAEHCVLEKYARGRKSALEIGVAEGASAVALRTAMNPEGTLYLVDPFHLSRVPVLNFLRRAAHRAVFSEDGPKIVWIEAFSHDAARQWDRPIDFLLIDGDHREDAVEQDWNDWTPHIAQNGVVAFHDARIFPGGWTSQEYGPVRFVNRMFRRDTSPEWRIHEEVDSVVVVSRKAG